MASGSPRRRRLLEELGLAVRVVPPASHVEDDFDLTTLDPTEAVQQLAELKGEAVLSQARAGEVLVAADTEVVFQGKALGKPGSRAQAEKMLERLSGQTHEVVTGYYLAWEQRRCRALATTRVRFRRLEASEIEHYVATGESDDKAGAYGIQGLGRLLVEGIEGCYFNVVGLPLAAVATSLRSWGVRLL